MSDYQRSNDYLTEESENHQFIQEEAKRIHRNRKANERRKNRDQIRRDLGLVKVRGNLGEIYWE